MKNHPDQPDATWHLTQRVNWRAWHLEPDGAYAKVVEAFDEAATRFGVDVLSFVAMSNHIHACLRSPAESRFRELTSRRTKCRHRRPYPRGHTKSSVIGQFARQFSLHVAHAIQDDLGLEGHLWGGPHDRRLVRSPRHLVAVIAYGHRNPVKAGMVSKPEDYGRSTAAWWASNGPSPLPVVRRGELPFDLSLEELRSAVLAYQADRQLDAAMAEFARTRLRPDSDVGAARLESILDEYGLGSVDAARLPRSALRKC
ncbi:MAG: transposase [Planctomycetota bacterium]|jgi:REP element-mobilizing transposase RayT